MGSPSCLIDPHLPIVLDTSAAINLVATGLASDILRALPNPVLATDAVSVNLHREPAAEGVMPTGWMSS